MAQIKIGTVVSNKMQKTVVVKVEGLTKHPLYKKQVKKFKKFKAYDEVGIQIGDKVKIVETKPIAKTVYFKVLEVLK